MSTVGKIIITTLLVVVIALGVWWVIQSMSTDTGEQQQTNGQVDEDVNDTEDQEVAFDIVYDGTSFTPASGTVRAGDVIQITNNSSNVLSFASDAHPTHEDNSELNVGDIEPGASATFTISSAGTWGYHDHYNASASGEIVVE